MMEWDRSRLIDDEVGNPGESNQNLEENGAVQHSSDGETQDNQPEEPVQYTSQLAALLITVNVTVGAGLLAMPYAMQTSGLATSVIIQLIFLVTIVTTCIICTELTVKTGVNSYHRLVRAHCHPYMYQFTQVSLLLIVFGVTVAFMVIIGDQSDRVFASLYGSSFCNTWYMNRRFIMSFATVFFMKPLCSAKTVEFLKYGSFAGVLSLGFVLYVVTSEFIKQGHVAKDVNYLPSKWSDVFTIIPVFCLAYQCHLSWVPTAATIRKEEKYRTYVTITIAMIVATIVYMVVSVLALLTFGSAILTDLTESYPGKSWPILTTIAIIAFKCIMTLPPAFLPLRLSLVDILSSRFKFFSDLSEPIKRISVTYVTLTTALLLALFVPNVLVAVDILGCLAVLFIFTLPGLCYLNLIKENRLAKQQLAGSSSETPIYSLKDKFKRTLSYFFIIFGILTTFIVLYKSVKEMLEKSSSPPLCHAP